MKIKEKYLFLIQTHKLQFFLTGIVIFFVGFLLISIYFDASFISRPYGIETMDAQMEFFTNIGGSTEGTEVLYVLPLQRVLFKGLAHFAPAEFLVGYSAGDYREYAYLLLAQMIVILFSLLLSFFSMQEGLYDRSKAVETVFPLAFLLSAPLLHTILNGDITILVFALSAFYCFYYENESEILKVLSYIALAIAIALCIYPMFLLVLDVKKKHYRNIIFIVGCALWLTYLAVIVIGLDKTLSSTLVQVETLFFKQGNIFPNVANGIFLVMIGKILCCTMLCILAFYSDSDWVRMMALVSAIVVFPKLTGNNGLLFYWLSFIPYANSFLGDVKDNPYADCYALQGLLWMMYFICFIPLEERIYQIIVVGFIVLIFGLTILEPIRH